jgi:uncharacterized protein (TIGR02271 family)
VTRRGRQRPIADERLDETRVHDRPLGDAGRTAEPVERLERVEEQLVPEVVRREAGAVGIRRRVVEEPEELEVTLRHDELDLERRPADRPLEPGEAPVVERGDTTVVLVVEERLEVRKVPWVVEEIHLRRRLVDEQLRVTDTVRKERIDIEPKGDVHLNTADH